ncbi:DUF418 domain-containing protein [Erythrobacter crassostreae]|uniref:DUF418 domain-containing protein n=1 Tax=Erythrobacter crassostreae TaxID=2828328 RepID=A0A9X1F2X0_9SPHN|nr:DUF418 domain-containing protein [Erythrobacter crassostrea]MBV7258348.1 DUF418 domain-containing protein [Erythrobacter crassostrea]
MAAHPTGPKRITELDALRGLAVIGIVWMNVYVFAFPLQAYYNPSVWGGETAVDQIVWATSFVFIEDKFRTLFAMMFGAGCLILLEREGVTKWRPHVARMVVLFALGIAHSVFLASNDVLRVYAVAGLALPFLAQFSHRALYAIAIGFVAVHVGGGIVAFGSAMVDYFAGRTESDASLFVQRGFGHDGPALRYALELGREGFADRIIRRAGDIPAQLWAISASIPINLAGMTLGMALWKDRMLARAWRMFRMQRLAAICALIALPPLLALAWWVSDKGFPGSLVGPVSLILSAPFDTLLALAYAALAMAFFSASGRATRLLASVGKLSLTNYVMTSVILSVIFASWGFGLFGDVTRAQAFALSFVPIAAMLIWSPLWAMWFGKGPLERVWRSMAKGLS